MTNLQPIKELEPEKLNITRRQYTPEYRVKLAVEAVEIGNVSAIARKYNVPTQTIDNWVNKL
jgi:transposase-like protein